MKNFFFVALTVAVLAACNKQPAQGSAENPTTNQAAQPSTSQSSAEKTRTYNGPFGLASSISIAELERMGFKTRSGGSDALFFGQPPKPFQDADEYAVVATPVAGACRIVAHVKVPVVNGSGDQLKAKTDQIAEAMRLKYGKYGEKVDYIKRDVYRDNPEYWMLGLKEESVYYAYDWTAPKTEKPLPGDIENIEVSAETSWLDRGYVAIKYTFKNFDACHKEMDVKKSSSL